MACLALTLKTDQAYGWRGNTTDKNKEMKKTRATDGTNDGGIYYPQSVSMRGETRLVSRHPKSFARRAKP